VDIEEGGYKDWAVDVEPGDANSFPTEDSIEHVYVVVTDKDSGEVYEGKLFLVQGVTAAPPDSTSFKSLGSPARIQGDKGFPEGETLAKTEKCRHGLPTTYKGQKVGCGICDEEPKQQEYWDSVKEEQSRQLIRQQRAAQQEWKFRCKDEGGF
jgi:hypothetical protein